MKSIKLLTILSVAFFASIFTSCSDNSSSADGNSFDAAEVCPTEGTNAYGEPNRGTFTDARDGQVYKYTTIGNQVWIAQNLNFDDGMSPCADTLCTIEKGRIYTTVTAQTACPTGWHLPSAEEWQVLLASVGGIENAGYHLKATEGWVPLNPGWQSNGTDECGFAVKPIPVNGVLGNGDGGKKRDGFIALLWTSTPADYTWYAVEFQTQNLHAVIADDRVGYLSVRCVRD